MFAGVRVKADVSVIGLYYVSDSTLDPDELGQFAARALAGYKVPRHIRFWPEPLPQNASGKLHKLKTREMFLEGS